MAPHSSTLAWKIPWTEEPGGLQSMGLWRVGHDWATSLSLFTFMHEKEMATHSSVLAWRIPGTTESGGLPSMGSHRVGHNWSDLAAAAAAAKYTPPMSWSRYFHSLKPISGLVPQFSFSLCPVYPCYRDFAVTQLPLLIHVDLSLNILA